MPARMPGIAATQAPRSEQAPARYTMAPDSFEGITGTGGEKSATGRKQRAEGYLVTPDQPANSAGSETGGVSSRSSSTFAWGSCARWGASLVRTTQSHPESLSCLKRKTSLINRLM